MESYSVRCPYCGETFEALIDISGGPQHYIEDCEICCRPIRFDLRVDLDGCAVVETRREDDA
jgi:hypothetical protein